VLCCSDICLCCAVQTYVCAVLFRHMSALCCSDICLRCAVQTYVCAVLFRHMSVLCCSDICLCCAVSLMRKVQRMKATKFTCEFNISPFVKAEFYVPFKIVAHSFGGKEIQCSSVRPQLIYCSGLRQRKLNAETCG
jgi:hypothetical protein